MQPCFGCFYEISIILLPFCKISVILLPFCNISIILLPFCEISVILLPFCDISIILLPFCNISEEKVSTHFYVARLSNKIMIVVVTKQNASVLSYDQQTQKSYCSFIQTYIPFRKCK